MYLIRYFTDKINGKHVNTALKTVSKNSGAYVLFLGKVRSDSVKKKIVKRIEYSSYPKLSEKIIQKIEKDIVKKYQLQRIIIRHRLGKVNAGEIAMLVCAVASHRERALQALKEIIEHVKKEVPIWKKEIYSDGSYKWVM